MGSLIGGSPKVAPAPTPPPVAPVPDTAALQASQQQQAAMLAQRNGRASTILSPTYAGASEKMGS